MKRLPVILSAVLALVVGMTILSVGCSQSAPAAAPTKAPAAEPTKAAAAPAAQPTTAAAAVAPTAVPAKKVDFPTKGKVVTLLVPYAAGGPSDVMGRLMIPALQDALGTTVEVVDKPGASSQVGMTEVVKGKPDGYTIGQMNIPSGLTIYLDPERGATFGRKDIAPLAVMTRAPETILVKADSPYNTLKDLVDAAKAKPGKVSLGSTGYMGTPHLSALQFAKLAGVEFGVVHFDGSAPATTALLGGHVDAVVGNVDPPYISAVKGGTARSLGVMDDKENKYLPGVPTFASQGYAFKAYQTFGWVLPGGTPKEIVDVLSAAFEKTCQSPDFIKKMDDVGLKVEYSGPAEMGAFWDEVEVSVKPIMEMAKQQQK